MTTIKDSVHGHVRIDPVAEDLIDTPAFQRLRHVKQLATVRLVYPSANHTRFEHSLGVYHLARRALRWLDVSGERAAHLRAAALLHDVAHGPYGHQTEDVITRHAGRHHDEVGWLLADSTLGEVLEEHGLDPKRVAGLVRGDAPLGELVSGELDVDRMDYLVRDAHHTGVPYGTVDHGRLLSQLRYRDGRLVLAEGNVRTAESLMVARSLMNGIVYRHHVSRIAGAMLDRASELLLASGTGIEEFARMADHDLLIALRREVPELGRRIECRDLYKRAAWVGLESVSTDVIEATHTEIRDTEQEIAERAGVDPIEVIVDVPSRPELVESRLRVLDRGDIQPLEEASDLVSALRDAERGRWRLGVYAPGDAIEVVGDAAAGVLGVPAGRP